LASSDLVGRGDFLFEVGAADFGFVVANGHAVGGGFSDDVDFFLSAGNGGVEEVALQHHEVRFHERDDDDRVFRSL